MAKVGLDQLDKQETWQGDLEHQVSANPGKVLSDQTDALENNPQTQNGEDGRGNRQGKIKISNHQVS